MTNPVTAETTLGVVSALRAYHHQGGIYIHVAFGRVIDRLADHYDKVYLTVPAIEGPPERSSDHRLQASNVEVISQPFYRSLMGALWHPFGIIGAYLRTCRNARVLFIRGLCPFGLLLYVFAWLYRCRVTHWIVNNPVALLGSNPRRGRLRDACSMLFARIDRFCTRLGGRWTRARFICNGRELANLFPSPRTVVVVSGTVTQAEFFERDDTCQGGKIRILFVGFLRPEKGVEYLIEAVSGLKTKRPWELIVVGPSDQFETYRKKLDNLVGQFKIGDRVRWEGYVSYGPPMLQYLRDADLFVLPTLSEGTPRVLVEAMANSLPVVATDVGGIPTSVTHGVDGLLVPPKDPGALAAAIERVVSDGELRRALMRAGLRTARARTVDRFVANIVEVLRESED